MLDTPQCYHITIVITHALVDLRQFSEPEANPKMGTKNLSSLELQDE